MYMMTPKDHISHDLSYFSGPRTSGAVKKDRINLKNKLHYEYIIIKIVKIYIL